MKYFALAFALCSFGATLIGCGGGGGGGGGGGNPTAVQIENKQTSITVNTKFTFTAQTIHNHHNPQGVTWTLTPANGEGTISNVVNSGSVSSVDYTAPSASCSNCVTITATSVENPSSTDSNTFSIAGTALVVSTTALPNGEMGIPYGSALQATGGTPPYTWSVSSGSLPIGFAITTNNANTTGQTITAITGAPAATGTTQFTVKVSDSANPAGSMTQPLSITINNPPNANNPELKGQYAYEINSFGSVAGYQHAEVGSFTADGNGNITKGVVDVNGPNGFFPTLAITGGSYAVGPDHRGTATFNFLGGGSRTIAFALGSLNGSNLATAGRLIEFDYTTAVGGPVGSGAMYLQQSSAFALASIKGPYAFQLIGQGTFAGARVVETGAVTADGAGNLNSGEFDLNTTGTDTNTAFTATLTTDATNTATSGRLAFKFATGASGNAVLYIISPGHAFIMTTDVESSSGLLSGEWLSQSSTSFLTSDLKGNAVFYLEGQGQIAGDSVATLGLISFDGAGNATLVSRDKNDAGFHTTKTNKTGITYSIASNGRVTITGIDNPTISYLVSPNSAFIMETSGSVTAGFVELQSGGPFSGASISGNYIFGVAPPAVPASIVSSGVATSTGGGTLNVTSDESGSFGLALGQAIMATGFNVAANGVGTDSVGDVIYMLSPTKAVLINVSPSAPEVFIIQQ